MRHWNIIHCWFLFLLKKKLNIKDFYQTIDFFSSIFHDWNVRFRHHSRRTQAMVPQGLQGKVAIAAHPSHFIHHFRTGEFYLPTGYNRTFDKKLSLSKYITYFTFWQRHVHAWALDHRVHHKYTETDSDPHNAKRGFWFAHVGWLFLTPHPYVEEKRKAVDMSDLDADPIVVWQRRYKLMRKINNWIWLLKNGKKTLTFRRRIISGV